MEVLSEATQVPENKPTRQKLSSILGRCGMTSRKIQLQRFETHFKTSDS